uniref:Uncharacterized protein n=1 Tax=Setaria italica TaxID=4555 RepID=K3YDT8_SETIT
MNRGGLQSRSTQAAVESAALAVVVGGAPDAAAVATGGTPVAGGAPGAGGLLGPRAPATSSFPALSAYPACAW